MTWMYKSELDSLLTHESKHKHEMTEADYAAEIHKLRQERKRIDKSINSKINQIKTGKDPRHKEQMPGLDHGAGYNAAMYDIHKAATRPTGKTVKGVSQRREYNYLYPR